MSMQVNILAQSKFPGWKNIFIAIDRYKNIYNIGVCVIGQKSSSIIN